jgi:hypothetical protein
LAFVFLLALLVTGSFQTAHAQEGAGNALDGQARFLRFCTRCHGVPPDHRAMNGANRPDVIRLAANNAPGMGFLIALLTSKDYDDLAAFIADKALSSNVVTVAATGDGTGFITSTPNGLACGGVCAWGFPLGTSITVRATPNRGTAFAGWTGACQGKEDCALEMNGGKVAYARFVRNGPTADYSGMWWGGAAENGWGVSITHRAVSGQQFVALYIYDQNGEPIWVAMPGGVWSENFSVIRGQVYRPSGAPLDRYSREAFSANASVGEVSLRFVSDQQIEMSYRIDGIAGEKRLQRQSFGTANESSPINVGDLWWVGDEENGWGMSIADQGAQLFAVWFSYDRQGRATWLAMPGGVRNGTEFRGALYRTQSAKWLGAPYDAAKFLATPIGTMAFNISNAARIEFSAQITTGEFAGLHQTKTLVRQPF